MSRERLSPGKHYLLRILGGVLLSGSTAAISCSDQNPPPPTPLIRQSEKILPAPTLTPAVTREVKVPTPEIPLVELKESGLGKVLVVRKTTDEKRSYAEPTPRPSMQPISVDDFTVSLVDGRESILITKHATSRPEWSMAGDKFALVLNSSLVYRKDKSISIYDQDGKNLAADIGKGKYILDVVWSSDGNSIIYTTSLDGYLANDFYEYSLRTGEFSQILDGRDRVYDHNPSVSPDGQKIVFVHNEWGAFYYIILADLNPKKLPYTGEDRYNKHLNPNFTLLTEGKNNRYSDAAVKFQWSHDSKKVIFSVDGQDKSYIADIEKGNIQEITARGKTVGNIDVSNDGTKFTFLDQDRNESLAIRDFEGKDISVVSLPSLPWGEPNATWIKGDQKVLISGIPSTDKFYTVNANGSDLRQVVLPFKPDFLNEQLSFQYAGNLGSPVNTIHYDRILIIKASKIGS